MIIFDVDSVRLKSVVETNPKVVDKLNQKYNAERIRKEIKAETVGLVSQYLGKRLVNVNHIWTIGCEII